MGVLDKAPTQAPFSILGLLLGGRSYGANYFAQHDQLIQQANERARIGGEANSLLASPQYKAVFDTPDKQAAGALWAKMVPNFDAMGNNLLSQKIGSIYNAQSQAQQAGYQAQAQAQGAGYQEQSTRLSDQLERERMGINVNDQLNMDAVKRQRDLQDTQNQYKYLLGLPAAIGTTAALDKLGIKPPADSMFTGMDPNTGMPQVSVIRHSPTWNKGMEELIPAKDSVDSLQVLSDMASNKVPFNQGVWNSTRNTLVSNMIAGKGSYDDGLERFINQQLPDESHLTPDIMKTKATQLQMELNKAIGRAQQSSQKWGIGLDEVPNSALKLGGGLPNVPPPDTDPNAAQKQLQKQADQVPGTTRQGRYNPRAGGILIDQTPAYKPKSTSRTGQPIQ